MNIAETNNATREHIATVSGLISQIISRLLVRQNLHDVSKLKSPEVEIFTEYTPKLAGCTYGSEEYKQFLKGMGPALKHHYQNNSHHPEHFGEPPNLRGMTLIDLIEMFCDWKAATLRHNDGDIYKSVRFNQKRFNFSDDIRSILINTLGDLNW